MAGPGLFVVGTDTDVGKTAVAVAIVRQLVAAGLRVGVSKPVASGTTPGDPAGDAARLLVAAARVLPPAAVCPQTFNAPLAPPDAARAEGRSVDERLLRMVLRDCLRDGDCGVVEGAGGLFSPLGDTTTAVDLAREFGLPVVIVDAARLGMIGRTLMAVRAARAEGLRVAAIVLSQTTAPHGTDDDPTSADRIAAAGMTAIAARHPEIPLAMLRHGADTILPRIDWLACATGHR